MYKWRRVRAILKTNSRKNDEKRRERERDQAVGAIWKFEHEEGQIEFFAGNIETCFLTLPRH